MRLWLGIVWDCWGDFSSNFKTWGGKGPEGTFQQVMPSLWVHVSTLFGTLRTHIQQPTMWTRWEFSLLQPRGPWPVAENVGLSQLHNGILKTIKHQGFSQNNDSLGETQNPMAFHCLSSWFSAWEWSSWPIPNVWTNRRSLLGKLGFSIFGWLRLFGQRSSSGTFAKTWARKVWDIRTSVKL